MRSRWGFAGITGVITIRRNAHPGLYKALTSEDISDAAAYSLVNAYRGCLNERKIVRENLGDGSQISLRTDRCVSCEEPAVQVRFDIHFGRRQAVAAHQALADNILAESSWQYSGMKGTVTVDRQSDPDMYAMLRRAQFRELRRASQSLLRDLETDADAAAVSSGCRFSHERIALTSVSVRPHTIVIAGCGA